MDLSRRTLEAHSVDMRQFADGRLTVLESGQRVIDVFNSSGLTFTLLPDRGLDIWMAAFNGKSLTWISSGSPHRPDHGSPWLRQFNGGLLTTCGLQHAGPAEVDDETHEPRDVHGMYTRLPAQIIRCEAQWEGESYILEVVGDVSQARLFGEQLRLRRTYRVKLGEPAVEIRDVVTNISDSPSPFMLLYHFNLGYPLVNEHTNLRVPAQETMPRDDAARGGVDAWSSFSAAQANYSEQVFYHRVMTADGWSQVLVADDKFGLKLSWDTTNAPYFTQWKNVRQGLYVSGIEPGNCIPEGRNAARRVGRLVFLQPGESQEFASKLEIVDGTDAVSHAAAQIWDLAERGSAVENVNWRA